jgi:hypothetical protein
MALTYHPEPTSGSSQRDIVAQVISDRHDRVTAALKEDGGR